MSESSAAAGDKTGVSGLHDSENSEVSNGLNRYDSLSAAPSDRELRIMWISWSALSGTVALFVCFVLLAILASRKARNRSFNLYLVFLTIPDLFFSVACAITCALNATVGYYYSDWMCNFQAFYCAFAFTSNAWLNAVTVRQVHTMLRFSYRRQRYKPPTKSRVVYQSLAVYAYSVFIGSVSLYNMPIHRHDQVNDLACLPIAVDTPSTLFFWLCFVWLWLGIPIVYVIYVWIDVYRKKLLPHSGRTRSVAIFFARITTVFLLMWLPTVIAIYIAGASSYWFSFVGGSWSHLQPAVSIGVSLLKGDIRQAFYELLCCRCFTRPEVIEEAEVSEENRPRRRRSSTFGSFILSRNFAQRASKERKKKSGSDGFDNQDLPCRPPSPLVMPSEGFFSGFILCTRLSHSAICKNWRR